jgi:hypothetical protein
VFVMGAADGQLWVSRSAIAKNAMEPVNAAATFVVAWPRSSRQIQMADSRTDSPTWTAGICNLPGRYVRFGSKADILAAVRHVRSSPKSRHREIVLECLLCANSGHRACDALWNQGTTNRGLDLSWFCANKNHLNCTARRCTGRRPVVAQQLHRWEWHSVARCEAAAAYNDLISIRAGAVRWIDDDREVLSWRSRRSDRFGGPSHPGVAFISLIATRIICSPHSSLNYFRLAHDVPFSL